MRMFTFQMHVRKRKRLVRFGLMHLLAANLVVWVRALTFEILEGVHHANHEHHDASPHAVQDVSSSDEGEK